MPQNQFTIPSTAKGVILPGWILTPNSKVVIRWIGGYWTSNPNVPPPQYDANGNQNYNASGAYLLPGAKEGSLVACIGNPAISKWGVGNYGVVGGDGHSAGQLWVACNDDWNASTGAGYADNKGSVIIQVVPYGQFLQELSDDDAMQEFIATVGKEVGIDSFEKLKEEIKSNSDKVLNITSESSTENVGQKVEE